MRMGLRSRWSGVAIAAVVVLAASPARADDPPPPPYEAAPPAQPPGAPPPYQPPPPPPYPPPPYQQPPPPGYGVPVYGPAKITDFDDSQPVPYGYTAVSQRRKGLIIVGACLLGAVYGYTAFAASSAELLFTDEDTDLTPLRIPVVGPFLELRETDNSVLRFALVLDGVAQTAGALMVVYGLTTPRTILVRNDRLTIAPMVRPGAAGLVLSGRF
jgi:hypothetical protein